MTSPSPSPLLSGRSQQLFPALIGILVVVILAAFADVAVTASAAQSVGTQYQFQVVGLFLASIPQVAVALALIAAIGTLGGQRTAVRAASFTAVVLGALVIIAIPFFVLDLLQSRHLVARNALHGFTIAAVKAGGFAGWLALVLIWAGVRGIQASRRPEESEARGKGQGLVVGQD